ncbi:MAG: hypothetical protein PHR25_03510 [Clostridia bacterium]|nr:hypothetical protein [Clostridia bacterium]MDD4375828.1 hypothetical protein [Clostridia bacterium]
MTKNFKTGISLIVLVITIIIIIIVATAVIFTLMETGIINTSSKGVFLNDLSIFKEELEMYKGNKLLNSSGNYNPEKLQADDVSITYGEEVDSNKNITNIISSLKSKTNYIGQFAVMDGRLIYQGSNEKMQDWAREEGTEVVIVGEPKVIITNPNPNLVKQGMDVIYTVKFISNAQLSNINLTGKIELVTDNGEVVNPQPEIIIGSATGTNIDSTREVEITIKTEGLSNGGYKLKVKAGVVKNSDGLSNKSDTISLIGFDINDNPPNIPDINATPVEWTNGNVTVDIEYSSDTSTKLYSYDSQNWITYTSPLVLTENTVVYGKALNTLGIESGLATITITNIDKKSPIVTFEKNGENNFTEVSTIVTVIDNLSGMNTMHYVWSNQNVNLPTSGWTLFTSGENLTKTGDGEYYLWIKAIDKAGNITTISSNKFVIGEEVEIVSEVSPYNKTFSGQTDGYSHNNPVIPAGFVALNTNDAKWTNLTTNWDNGLVIQDVNGNQFVWVPIKDGAGVDGAYPSGSTKTVQYKKWCTTNISYVNTINDSAPSGYNITNINTKYKGFYIARYEAMFDYNNGNIRAASKKSINKTTLSWENTRNAIYNGYLWNFINYIDAKKYSEEMATKYTYNTYLVGTMLINGTQWDTAMKWIQSSNINVTDSRSWGNYGDPIYPADILGYRNLQISGFSNYWKAKNIYDLAGNVMEWTSEIQNSSPVYRGGGYEFNGAGAPAAVRYRGNATTSINRFLGFRVGLYIL